MFDLRLNGNEILGNINNRKIVKNPALTDWDFLLEKLSGTIVMYLNNAKGLTFLPYLSYLQTIALSSWFGQLRSRSRNPTLAPER